MSVTIVTYTQFGPFQEGSTLKVSPGYARQLIQQYGFGLRIQRQGPSLIYVYPSYFPPRPLCRNGVYITFRQNVGLEYKKGNTYCKNPNGWRMILENYPNIVLFDGDGNTVDDSELEDYIGERLYADIYYFAFRQNQNGFGPMNSTQE